jgi:DNA-binding MarR family transcriptional regulator
VEDTPWLDESEARAWRAVILLQTQLRGVLARGLQRESGLSESDYEVLVHLSEAPEQRLRPFEIGRATRWEKSRLSHHLRRMSDRGLVEMVQCESDNRGAVVVLTDTGLRAIVAAAPGHVRLVRSSFFDHLSDDQVATLAAIGAQVEAALAGADPCGDSCDEDSAPTQ